MGVAETPKNAIIGPVHMKVLLCEDLNHFDSLFSPEQPGDMLAPGVWIRG